jgi:hypothetical protein
MIVINAVSPIPNPSALKNLILVSFSLANNKCEEVAPRIRTSIVARKAKGIPLI